MLIRKSNRSVRFPILSIDIEPFTCWANIGTINLASLPLKNAVLSFVTFPWLTKFGDEFSSSSTAMASFRFGFSRFLNGQRGSGLVKFFCFSAQAFFQFPHFRSELRTEILCLEDWTQLDFSFVRSFGIVRNALRPLERFLH